MLRALMLSVMVGLVAVPACADEITGISVSPPGQATLAPGDLITFTVDVTINDPAGAVVWFTPLLAGRPASGLDAATRSRRAVAGRQTLQRRFRAVSPGDPAIDGVSIAIGDASDPNLTRAAATARLGPVAIIESAFRVPDESSGEPPGGDGPAGGVMRRTVLGTGAVEVLHANGWRELRDRSGGYTLYDPGGEAARSVATRRVEVPPSRPAADGLSYDLSHWLDRHADDLLIDIERFGGAASRANYLDFESYTAGDVFARIELRRRYLNLMLLDYDYGY